MTARLAVLGSPIAHSQSPTLHAAAYAVLGLDWSYEAVDVTGDTLAGFVGSRDESWRGLSLTMPLKRDILPLLDSRDPVVDLAGGANTVLFDYGAPTRTVRGFNTDVYGIHRAFAAAGVSQLSSVQILGGGATAASVVVAAHELGARKVLISVRSPLKAIQLAQLGERLEMAVIVRSFGEEVATDGIPDAVVSTLPGGTNIGATFSEKLRSRAVLFDVAYDPWPSALASQWLDAGGRVIPGIDMLLYQALAQIRIFVAGSPQAALPREDDVLAAMRAAIGR
ncbi:MAG: shikimate dehydrogenase [Glaciihabitans sp.]|nr:shikimate dehydrogenase [Glaciihabitans sp.]